MMRCLWILLLVALGNSLAIATATVAANANTNPATHVLMEQSRLPYRSDVKKLHRADPDLKHTVLFALNRRNMKELERVLHEVSDPFSPSYGRHWTREQVAAFTADQEAKDRLLAFLQAQPETKIEKVNRFGEYVRVSAPVRVWEEVFQTEFHVYRVSTMHSMAGEARSKEVVRAESYSLPVALADSVAAVFKTVQFPQLMPRPKDLAGGHEARKQRDELLSQLAKKKKEEEEEAAALAAGAGRTVNWNAAGFAFGYVTPAFINYHYNISNNTGSSLVSQAVFESLDDAMSPSDLTYFQETFDLPVQPIAEDIGGHVSDQACNTNRFADCYESNLDVQYLMGVAQNIPTTYYYFDDDNGNIDFSEWLADVLDLPNPSFVYSISYGGYELGCTQSELDQFSTDAITLGVIGTTLLASSGDDGVSGFLARGQPGNCGYFPQFPASSPYVTAVGGTEGPQLDNPEVVCQATSWGVLITSGGGFSNYYDRPSWQDSVISSYFDIVNGTDLDPFYSLEYNDFYGYAWQSSYFNKNGRAYPDVSLLAHGYLVAADGSLTSVDGTSASSPVMAAFVSLVNYRRREAGFSTMGWLNPFLYSNFSSFVVDITEGNNNCTAVYDYDSGTNQYLFTECPQGYMAAPGWDPATGLGAVNFEEFLNAALSTGGTWHPSISPTTGPTRRPSSSRPSKPPTLSPSVSPTFSQAPSAQPVTDAPTMVPSVAPVGPTRAPSLAPTLSPSLTTTHPPSRTPTHSPSGTSNSNSNGDVNVGAAVGGAVGGFVVLLVVLGVIYYCVLVARSSAKYESTEKVEMNAM